MNSFQVSKDIAKDFDARLLRVIKAFQRKMITALSGLETEGGKAVSSEFNINYATELYAQLLKDLDEAGYGDAVQQLIGTDSGKLIKSLKQTSKIPLEFTQSSLQTITALQSSKLAGFTAIGERAINSIREEVMRTVLTGSRIEDAVGVIADNLEKQFKSYAYTYANTALRDAMQLSIYEGVKQAVDDGFEVYWEFTGPDDDVTRPACQEGLLIGFFIDAEREQFESETADERAYNCRHAFVPILKEEYDRGVNDRGEYL